MHIIFWITSVILNGPAAMSSYFTTEAPLLRGANENTCTRALSQRWPQSLSTSEAQILNKSSKRAHVVPLIEDINARMDAAGVTEASLKVLEQANDILLHPPFVGVAGPRLIRVFPSFSNAEMVVVVSELNAGHESWVIKLESTEIIYPLVGSSDGHFLALTDPSERFLDVVDLDTRRTILRVQPSSEVDGLTGHAYCVHAAFSPESTFITVSQPDRIEVFNLSTSPPIKVIEKHFPITELDPASEDLPDGFRGRAEYLAGTGQIIVWYHHHAPLIISPLQKWSSEVETTGVNVAGDLGLVGPGQTAFIAHDNGNIDVVDTQSGNLLRTLNGQPQPIRRFATSPSGRYLAVALHFDQGALIFDLASSSKCPRYKLNIESGGGELIGFANEKTVVCGDRDLAEAFGVELP